MCEHKAYRAVNYSLNYFAHNSQPCPLSNYNSPGKARTPQPLVCWAPPSWPPSHCEYLWFRVTQAQLMDLYNSNEHDDDADSNSKLQWQQDNNCIYIYIQTKAKQEHATHAENSLTRLHFQVLYCTLLVFGVKSVYISENPHTFYSQRKSIMSSQLLGALSSQLLGSLPACSCLASDRAASSTGL